MFAEYGSLKNKLKIKQSCQILKKKTNNTLRARCYFTKSLTGTMELGAIKFYGQCTLLQDSQFR